MSEDNLMPNEEERRQIDEQRVLIENVQKEYSKLKKEDPRFIGIDTINAEYWIAGHGWRIKKLGFTNQEIIAEYFTQHDKIVEKHDKLPLEENAGERVGLMADLMNLRRTIIKECIPLVLSELDGKPLDTKKAFSDEIDGAVWWDCIRDCYLFLRARGSREDILASMMLSSSVSQTNSNTTTKGKKST